jgi:hypothetical protein
MTTTTSDYRIVDTHRRIRNILAAYPATDWTLEESCSVLENLVGIVRARQAVTTTERHPLPPVVCAPWCEDGDGHTGSLFREEQTCWGQADYVDLSRERVTRDGPDVLVPRIGARAYQAMAGRISMRVRPS